MSSTTTARFRASTVAIAPVLLLGAFVWHPYLPGRLPNDAAIAAAVADGPTRWGLAHLAAAVLAGALTFALGCLAFAKAFATSEALGTRLTRLVAAALLVAALTRFVPLAAVQFYVQSAALIVALWPLAYAMRKQPQARPAGRAHPLPAS